MSVEGRDLRVALAALPALEQEVVVALRVEGWVEVDQVHARLMEVLAQDLQIVGEIQPLHGVFSDTVRRL